MRVNPSMKVIGSFFSLALLFFLFGCAGHQPLPQEASLWVYKAKSPAMKTVGKWAPAFAVYGHAKPYNRIGRPTVRPKSNGEDIYIDTRHPVVYFLRRSFSTAKATYTNLIYRVHFPEVPFSLIPFNLTAGNNVGLLVVVTLDADNLPVLVTTVHTCGCYKAIVPTQYLPKKDYPKDWNGEVLDVYGERLPPLLKFPAVSKPRILVSLRPEVHRVMNLEIRDDRDFLQPPFRIIPMKIAPMSNLEHLPDGNGTTSLYYTKGVMKGHVKGSIKPLETLLLSLPSMDLFIGSDKDYADPSTTGTPFYTSLKPWRREDSDMWDFARFLNYWGWRL